MRLKMKILMPAFLVIAFSLACFADVPATQPAFDVANVDGVWYQPVDSFAKWKRRGVKTVIGVPVDMTDASKVAPQLEAYLAAARAAELKVFVQAEAITEDRFYSDPRITAIINTPDEPDGAGNVSAGTMVLRYRAIKSKTTKSVFINFDAHRFAYVNAQQKADYRIYCQAGDIIGMDVYWANIGEPENIPTWLGHIALAKDWSGGKPIICFMECADQNLRKQKWVQDTPIQQKMRGPTVAEFVQQRELIKSSGCGVAYFPHEIGAGWGGFDATPADVEEAMISIASRGSTAKAYMPTNLDGKSITIDGINYKLLKQ